VNGKTGPRSVIARHNTEEYLRRIQQRFDSLNAMTFDELLKAKIDEYVFRLADGTRTTNLHQTFEVLMKETELAIGATSEKPRTLYSFRHMYATFQLQNKVGIHELARQMGTSVKMLEDHYSKITPELMASVFAGPKMGRQKDLEIDSIAKVVLGTVSAAADNASKK
jgi:integrase